MKITQKAIDAFGNILKEQGNPDFGIRIYAVQGCCSPSLQMTVTNKPETDDNIVEVDGLIFLLTTWRRLCSKMLPLIME